MKAVFVGLGNMGGPMAARILAAGLPLELYNRNPLKTEPFQSSGALIRKNLRDALKGADLVFTMLSDDQALSSVINSESLSSMSPGAIHVSFSTVSLKLIDSLVKLTTDLKRTHISSPVFGRPAAAAAGLLQLCLAGEDQAKERILKYLEPLGRIWDFGKDPKGANSVKLAGNLMISSMIETFSEAFLIVEKNGVDPNKLYTLMTETLFSAPAYKLSGDLILKGNFDEPGFALKLGAKDLGLVKEAAKDSLLPLPFASALEERFLRALARGWGERDWTAITELGKEDAGLS
jgi:3-hydroxyisobutyrate dehydrogenase-like beta-hydroxyacid dehydrogenase